MKQKRAFSFQARVFFGCLAVALIPLLLSGMVMMRIFTNSLQRRSEQETKFQIEEIAERFAGLQRNCEAACAKLAADETVSRAMLDNKSIEYQKDLYLLMYQAVQELYGYAQPGIYDMGGRLKFTTNPAKQNMQLPVNWGVLNKAAHHAGVVYYRTDSALSLSEQDVLMQAACVLETPEGMRTGYLVFDFTRRDFEHLLNGIYSAADTLTLLDSHMRPVYVSGSERGEGQPGTYVSRKVNGFTILLNREAPISPEAVRLMGTVVLMVSLLGLALCLVVSGALTRNLAHPVAQQQKSLNQTTLKLYQTQLNPHFLYNTLDSIKWNARINQIPEIAVLAENLAVILRRSISGESFVRLKEELEMIESYICIQKIRFTGRFLFETEIPDSLADCVIPKMILQPLVENAILHGLDGAENGYICIYGYQKDGMLYLSVTDNGCGMNEEMTAWINSPNPPKREGHLGLYNVMQILKLYYGEAYGLRAETTKEGTTVTMVLPARKEKPDV